MESMLSAVVTTFLVAFGVVLGGAVMGSLEAYLFHGPPLSTAVELADKLKLWALITALGGTFPPLKALELGFLSGQTAELAKQIILIFSAFFGAQGGCILLKNLIGRM